MSCETKIGTLKPDCYYAEPANIKITVSEIPGLEFFYNAAAWEIDGYVYLLGRFVEKPGGKNEPDVGELILVKLTPDLNIVSKEVVPIPKDKEYKLEDPRLIIIEKSLGHLAIIACTVVLKNEQGESIPYIGIIETEPNKIKESMASVEPIKEMCLGSQATPAGELDNDARGIINGKGKNGIPIDPANPDLFIFRPEGDKNDRTLLIIKRNENGTSIQQSIELNGIPWAQRRIGTTMPPIWLNENEALLPIHGITMKKKISIYSIGFAMLRKQIINQNVIFSIDNITEQPVITPDKIAENGIEITELHPDQRRVVYCCGGLPITDENGELVGLNMFLNVGDRKTVLVVVDVTDYLTKNSQNIMAPKAIHERALEQVA